MINNESWKQNRAYVNRDVLPTAKQGGFRQRSINAGLPPYMMNDWEGTPEIQKTMKEINSKKNFLMRDGKPVYIKK